MLRSALLMGILIDAHLATSAQDVLPLLGEPTRFWTSEFSGSGNGFCLDTWKTTNWIAGDTVINGTTYTVLHMRGRHYLSPLIDPCNEMQEYPLQDCFVREEEGAVYGLNPSGTAEYLIYDFTAEEGDTVPFPSNAGITWNMEAWATIVHKDSIVIDGNYRTRWEVSNDGNFQDTVYIIEGIGSTTGLFGPLVYVDFETSFLLNCVSEHGEVIFEQDGCELIIFIEENTTRKVALPYPNPSHGEIRLDDHVVRAEVISVDGRTLFAGRCTTHRLHCEGPGTVMIRGYDAGGALVGTWRATVMQD